jgi:DNA-binding HxlR family transcriptional regulator
LPRIAAKWTFLVIAVLSDPPGQPLRFSEVRRRLDGVSQKVLTATLRTLERDGFVVRHVFPEVPPRVDYALSEMGRGLIPSMRGLMEWMHASWPTVRASRAAFDHGRSSTSRAAG